MKEHVKIERLLQLLKLLSSNIGYDYEELAERIGVTERTIRRYLKSFERAGFFVENNNGYFRLEKTRSITKDINSVLHFSEEEAVILHNAINSIEASSLTKVNLREKLFALYNSDRINYPIIKNDSGKIKDIITAIREKNSIIIQKYKSSNSSKISNRIIEPFGFTNNYTHLWGFEIKQKKNYLFRISRIAGIEILNQKWQFEKEHNIPETDVFRMTGDTKTKVKLRLTLKAYNYLAEQFPLALDYVYKDTENCYIFSHWYFNVKGISRYILSAFDEVKVIFPQSLADYLNKKISNKKF